MFSEFCQQNNIKGNYKEALYRRLMVKYSEYEKPASVIDQLSTEVYQEEWQSLLSEIFEKVYGNTEE